MSVKAKIFFASIAIAFVALVIWVVYTTPTEPPVIEKIEPPTVMEYQGNTISEERDGVKIWDLTADRMIIEISTQNATLENLTGHFYQADGKTVEITADFGTYDNTSKDVHIEGSIKVNTSDGATLTADKLDWNAQREILTATDKVKITKDDMIATADVATSQNGFRRFKLKGRAHIIKGVDN